MVHLRSADASAVLPSQLDSYGVWKRSFEALKAEGAPGMACTGEWAHLPCPTAPACQAALLARLCKHTHTFIPPGPTPCPS